MVLEGDCVAERNEEDEVEFDSGLVDHVLFGVAGPPVGVLAVAVEVDAAAVGDDPE